MTKTKIRIFAVMLMTVLCMTAFSTTAFAGGGEDTTHPAPEQTEETTPTPVPLTPEGNLTLVDDVERTDEIDKQFITAVSKNGNYFYLVIDRAGKEDNVYLLNMVDEADLLALMEETPAEPKICSCKDKCELGAVNADCTVCGTNRNNCIGITTEPTEPAEPQPEKSKGNSMGIAALLLVFGLVGGGAFYYFKVVKNKAKPQNNPNVNEYDYSDDEDEDEYGYEPTSEEQEDDAGESEDDVK